ncbi:MAG: N-acetylneuraminate synthase family protein [Calditrichia bacterium]
MKKRIKVTENRYIGPDEPVFIIAEIGQNHNGEMEIAKQLIDVAAEAKVDAVKFVKRTIEDILTKEALERPYLGPNSFGATYGEHRRKLELSEEQHRELKAYAEEKGLIYFATPTDIKAADFLSELDIPLYKIASRDLINLPLLEHVAKKGKPVLLSTGMSTMEDIDEAVETILKYNEDLVVMHCTSEYPCAYEDVNLRMIHTLQKRYNLNVGYSGHTIGIVMPVVAAALGAVVVEKHITLARYMKGTDHAGSLEPDGLRRVVRDIRNLEKAMGDGIKRVYEGEIEVKHKIGKSLVVKTALPKGTVLTADMLTIKGPGTGISPRDLKKVVGRRLKVDKDEDTTLKWEEVE